MAHHCVMTVRVGTQVEKEPDFAFLALLGPTHQLVARHAGTAISANLVESRRMNVSSAKVGNTTRRRRATIAPTVLRTRIPQNKQLSARAQTLLNVSRLTRKNFALALLGSQESEQFAVPVLPEHTNLPMETTSVTRVKRSRRAQQHNRFVLHRRKIVFVLQVFTCTRKKPIEIRNIVRLFLKV